VQARLEKAVLSRSLLVLAKVLAVLYRWQQEMHSKVGMPEVHFNLQLGMRFLLTVLVVASTCKLVKLQVTAAVCPLSVALARPAQAEVSTLDPQTVGLPARAAA
jgi:hypothetical protein